KVLHFHDGGLRIDDAEIHDRVDRHRDVVSRHHLLLLDAEGDDAQIHSDHAIDDWDQENYARPFRAEQFSETKNHAALVFPQDPDRLRQDDDGENDDGDGPTDYLWQCFN